MVSLR